MVRLCRGWAAVAAAAVTTAPKGAKVNLLMPGAYAVTVEGGLLVLQVSGNAGDWTITVRGKEDCEADLSLFVPSWTDDAFIKVNDDGADEGKPGEYLTLHRIWKPGDVVVVQFAAPLWLEEGYHQSLTVRKGAQVMAWQPGVQWAVALVGKPVEKDGKVLAQLRPTLEWKQGKNVPGDLPVQPACDGEAFEAELLPYAACACRISAFPRGNKA